jgi:hypothetical protein
MRREVQRTTTDEEYLGIAVVEKNQNSFDNHI